MDIMLLDGLTVLHNVHSRIVGYSVVLQSGNQSPATGLFAACHAVEYTERKQTKADEKADINANAKANTIADR